MTSTQSLFLAIYIAGLLFHLFAMVLMDSAPWRKPLWRVPVLLLWPIVTVASCFGPPPEWLLRIYGTPCTVQQARDWERAQRQAAQGRD